MKITKIIIAFILVFSYINSNSQTKEQEAEQFIETFFNLLDDSCSQLSVENYEKFFSQYDETEAEYLLFNSFSDCKKKEYIAYMKSGNVNSNEYYKLFPNAQHFDSVYITVFQNPDKFPSLVLRHIKEYFASHGIDISKRKFKDVYHCNHRFSMYSYIFENTTGQTYTLKVVVDNKMEPRITDITNKDNKSIISIRGHQWQNE